ncbi:MAG: hypothetical protein ACOYOK_08055 [Pseudobdellovibrionaceae bacterium]
MKNKTNSDRLNLNKTLIDCKAKISEAVKAIDLVRDHNLIMEYELAGSDVRLLSVSDALSYLKFIIENKTDGRPQPFSIFDSDSQLLNLIQTKGAAMTPDQERELKVFAEVGGLSKKYTDGAAIYIAKYELKLNDTIRLRDWLTSVINWHSTNS